MATHIRTKPKAFSRPSIDLTTMTKKWVSTTVDSLESGDYVKGFSGPLQRIIKTPENHVVLVFLHEQSDALSPSTEVEAFTFTED